MRIAIATETFLPSVDGVVTRLTHTVDWLVAHGHDVAVIAPDLGVHEYRAHIDYVTDSYQTDRGGAAGAEPVPILGVPAVTYPFYRSRPWARPSSAVARHLDAFAPDVVHAAQPDILGAQAVHWASRTGTPLVTSYHTDVEKYVRHYLPSPIAGPTARAVVRYERSLHGRAAATIATSEAMRRRLAARGYANLAVIPRGVDLAARDPSFRSSAMRARLTGGQPARPLLVYVGRVAAEKGIGSLKTLVDAHPDWALAIVGDGPARADLQRSFSGTRTTFTGFLQGGDLSAAFASGDVFVFPSTSETLGLVIAEAQASGVAVLAADSPATREQIRNGIDGVVYGGGIGGRGGARALGRDGGRVLGRGRLPVDGGGVGDGRPTAGAGLLECAERLMGDRALRERIAAAGVEATRNAGWDASGAATFAVYERAIGAARAC